NQCDASAPRNLSLSEDSSALSIILSSSQIKQIMAKSRMLTKEEREAMLETKQKEREQAMVAAEERKACIWQADLERKRNQGLSEIETEARQQGQYLLEKANVMRTEQEDEIRKLNKVILDAQCNAVRDTQILEKKQIQKELHEEDLRLHSMMEVHRHRMMETEEQIEKLRKQQHLLGRAQIQKQIEERFEERLLQDEMKEQESQKMLENLKKIQMEELEALQKKKEQQKQLHLEIFKINQETTRAKERRMDEERLADLRDLEYIRQKMDELRARRNQEAAEREWRKKEKEKAQKEMEEVEKLKAAWLEQVTQKEHLLSIEAARNRTIAIEERKACIRQAEMDRKRNQGLSDIEADAQQQAQYLLEKANAMRMEQEDEIRKLNKVILDARCNAVRDTQILEKKQIQKELHEEELRLHSIMEASRHRALEAEEQTEKRRKQQHILKKEQQEQLQLEVFKINQETLRAKELRLEEERLADQRNLEYIQQKMEREAQHEEEQRKIKREKELELARLRALQERERDRKAEQDELRARRNQEAAEREWRRKQKEKAQKELEEVEKLKATWLQQITQKEHLLSIQAARNRAAFERVLRSQKEAIDRALEEEETRRQRMARHAEGIRQQMKEREAQAVENRRERLRRAERFKEEAQNRKARLHAIMEEKINELKQAGLPEKYWKEVEKKAFSLP
ncbi:coiled-coil domain-containing protein 19, mitochondrial-like, partial [Scleropages formosus]